MIWFLFEKGWITSNVGSVVEFSPATREARVRFPDVASFIDKDYFFINDRFVSEMKLTDVCCENSGSSHNLARINFHQNDRAKYTTTALKGLSKIISRRPGYFLESLGILNSYASQKLKLTQKDLPRLRQFVACDQNQPIL